MPSGVLIKGVGHASVPLVCSAFDEVHGLYCPSQARGGGVDDVQKGVVKSRVGWSVGARWKQMQLQHSSAGGR